MKGAFLVAFHDIYFHFFLLFLFVHFYFRFFLFMSHNKLLVICWVSLMTVIFFFLTFLYLHFLLAFFSIQIAFCCSNTMIFVSLSRRKVKERGVCNISSPSSFPGPNSLPSFIFFHPSSLCLLPAYLPTCESTFSKSEQ